MGSFKGDASSLMMLMMMMMIMIMTMLKIMIMIVMMLKMLKMLKMPTGAFVNSSAKKSSTLHNPYSLQPLRAKLHFITISIRSRAICVT